MYRLIADDLERQIKSGELARGGQLKSEVELREDYGQGEDSRASRNTIRDAIKLGLPVLLAQRPDTVTPADQAG